MRFSDPPPAELVVSPENQARLEHLFMERGLSNLKLPSLQPEESWLARLWDKLLDFVHSLLATHQPQMNLSWLPNLIIDALAVLVVACVGTVLFILIRAGIRFLREPPENPTSAAPPARAPHEALKDAMDEALVREEFSLASRLRWRLFQARRKLRESVTPAEFDPRATWLRGAYQLMFEPTRERRLETFHKLDLDLMSLEGNQTHGP